MKNNNQNILAHIWQKLLHPKWIFLIGVAIIGTGIAVTLTLTHKSSALSPSSGPEGTKITITYPKLPSTPSQVTAQFYDAGEHGYYAVNDGTAAYVAYDPKTGMSYSAPAGTSSSDNSHSTFTTTVPSGICGLIIQSSQEQPAPPKVIQVTLVGSDGKPVPGTKPSNFNLQCDKYTMTVKIKASADPVLPDGVSQSTITANLSVKGPAQFINGVRVKPGDPKIINDTPLGLVMVHFDHSLGNIAPDPANVKTDRAGDAVVTVSSPDAGIDKVQAIASGIGDAIVNVHFPPKITGVKEDFVQPNSPTNYVMSTIPANPKDLTFDWTFLPAPGPDCGNLTGPLSGLGEAANGFFHGPSKDFPDGCPEKWEMASNMQVTVTDKDGQSDSKTFSARKLEGQGLVKLP